MLLTALKTRVKANPSVHADSFGGYAALRVSQFHPVRINHLAEFARGCNHINGIENFWNQARRVLRKYNGIPRGSFPLFPKECEFRFNCGTHEQQLNTLKEWAGIQAYLLQLHKFFKLWMLLAIIASRSRNLAIP